jgi:hypothetical protein
MLGLEIPDLKDILHGELLERGEWLVANLETNLSWPVSAQKVIHRSIEFWLLPVTRESYPAVALNLKGMPREEGKRRLLRLLSAISWFEDSGIMLAGFSGGSLPRPLGREKSMGLTITADLELTGLPEPSDDKGQLALALMREGRGLNHPAYAFLSFYRVLEVCVPAKSRKKWISDHAEQIWDHRGKKALADLKLTGVADVGDHLSRSGRHAIAHAAEKPVIDPDEPSDSERLSAELPLMMGLAQLAIEKELGVKTSHTEWKEHLYELAGFKRLFGAALVESTMSGKEHEDGTEIDLPSIDVELRKRSPYLPLERLNLIHVAQRDKTIQVVFGSADGLVQIQFVLDFAEERLRFDWERGVNARDDGSTQAARNVAELARFLKDYLGNGELHLYESETRQLIARVGAFIPLNFWGNNDYFNALIEEWEKKAEERAAPSDARPV